MGCGICKKVKRLRYGFREPVYNLAGALQELGLQAERAHVSCFLAKREAQARAARRRGKSLAEIKAEEANGKS